MQVTILLKYFSSQTMPYLLPLASPKLFRYHPACQRTYVSIGEGLIKWCLVAGVPNRLSPSKDRANSQLTRLNVLCLRGRVRTCELLAPNQTVNQPHIYADEAHLLFVPM